MLSYEELKTLVEKVVTGIKVMQGGSTALADVEGLTEGIFTGEAKKPGEEMTYEEFFSSIERAGYRKNFTTAPEDIEEKTPPGLFNRLFAKRSEVVSLPKLPVSRFSSVTKLHTDRTEKGKLMLTARSISLTKRIYVVRNR